MKHFYRKKGGQPKIDMYEYEVGNDVKMVNLRRLINMYENELDGIMFPQIGLVKEPRNKHGKILCVDSKYGSK